MHQGPEPLAVTGIRVIDLFAPFPLGGSLAVGGDLGSGVNVVAMEVMHNLCQRYEARSVCRVTSEDPFNEANVRGWVDKLGVGPLVRSIEPGAIAAIEIRNERGPVATILPFATTTEGADAWVTIRRRVLDSGRLPAVALDESGSKHATEELRVLAGLVVDRVDHGDEGLIRFLGQPFFLAEPWTQSKGEITEPDAMLAQLRDLLGTVEQTGS